MDGAVLSHTQRHTHSSGALPCIPVCQGSPETQGPPPDPEPEKHSVITSATPGSKVISVNETLPSDLERRENLTLPERTTRQKEQVQSSKVSGKRYYCTLFSRLEKCGISGVIV